VPDQGWGAWDQSWVWSLLLIVFTIAIHAFGIVAIVPGLRWLHVGQSKRKGYFFHTHAGAVLVIAMTALALAVLHSIECLLWAWVYLKLGALPNPADAILYSVDSMATRGASNLTLSNRWLLMGALEAADGMLLFGVSTAFLFTVMQRIAATLGAGRYGGS